MQKEIGPRLLLVEDDPSTVMALRYLLERRGAVTEAVASGEEALASLGRARPDVIVLDLKLAGALDGFATLEKLKADPALSAVPVVILTNFGLSQERERAKALGADGYILKSDHTVHFIVDRLLDYAGHGVDDKPRIW